MVHVLNTNKMMEVITSTNLEKPLKVFSRTHPEVSTEMLERLDRELRKYLEIRGTYTVRYGISGIMDDLLHSFILCTEDYTTFCNAAFGGYLHHSPQTDQVGNIPLMYFRFLIDYVRHFKEIPPNDIWPHSNALFGNTSDVGLTRGECIADCFYNGGPGPHPVP